MEFVTVLGLFTNEAVLTYHLMIVTVMEIKKMLLEYAVAIVLQTWTTMEFVMISMNV